MRIQNPTAAGRVLLLSITLLALLTAAVAAQASPSNKWRLQCSGGANSDGTIVLLISPEGGTPIEASIAACPSGPLNRAFR